MRIDLIKYFNIQSKLNDYLAPISSHKSHLICDNCAVQKIYNKTDVSNKCMLKIKKPLKKCTLINLDSQKIKQAKCHL